MGKEIFEPRVLLRDTCLIYLIDDFNGPKDPYYKQISYNIFDSIIADGYAYRYFKNIIDANNFVNKEDKSVKYIFFIPLGMYSDINHIFMDLIGKEINQYSFIGSKIDNYFILNRNVNMYKSRPWNKTELSQIDNIDGDIATNYGSLLFRNTHEWSVYNCATEPLMKEPLPHIQRIVSPANGLQALNIIDKCEDVNEVVFMDINLSALEFTKKILNEYKGKSFFDICMQFLKEWGNKDNKIILQNNNADDINEYEKIFLNSLTHNFDKLKNRLQHITFIYEYETLLNLPKLIKYIEDAVQENGMAIDTLYNYSNIFHFRKSNFHFSQLHYNLFLKVLAAHEKINKTNSYFRGELPLVANNIFKKQNISRGHFQIHVNKIDLLPEKEFNYEWRPELYEYYENYLRILREKVERKSL